MTDTNIIDHSKGAYWLFKAFFICIISLIVLIGYFGFKDPFVQNTQLKQTIAGYEREKGMLVVFNRLMNKSRVMLLDSSYKDTSFANLQIADTLKKMRVLINKDSVVSKSLYLNIITNLVSLQQSQQQLKEAGGLDQKLNEIKDQIEKKGTKLDNINELMKLTSPKQ